MSTTMRMFEEPLVPAVTVQTASNSVTTANSPFEGWTDSLSADTADIARPALVAAPARFVQGGNAYFTLRSVKTGTRYTYRVAQAKDGSMFFVSLLAGPDNWENYRYMGIISRDRQFRTTAKSQYKADSTPVKAFAWTWERISAGRPIDGVELWHEGKCGRCGRRLTVPESIASGFGPECAGKMEGGF